VWLISNPKNRDEPLISAMLAHAPSMLPAYLDAAGLFSRPSTRFRLFSTEAHRAFDSDSVTISVKSVPVNGMWNLPSVMGYTLAIVAALIAVILPVWTKSTTVALAAGVVVVLGIGLIVAGGFDFITADPVAVGIAVLELRDDQKKAPTALADQAVYRSETTQLLRLISRAVAQPPHSGRLRAHEDHDRFDGISGPLQGSATSKHSYVASRVPLLTRVAVTAVALAMLELTVTLTGLNFKSAEDGVAIAGTAAGMIAGGLLGAQFGRSRKAAAEAARASAEKLAAMALGRLDPDVADDLLKRLLPGSESTSLMAVVSPARPAQSAQVPGALRLPRFDKTAIRMAASPLAPTQRQETKIGGLTFVLRNAEGDGLDILVEYSSEAARSKVLPVTVVTAQRISDYLLIFRAEESGKWVADIEAPGIEDWADVFIRDVREQASLTADDAEAVARSVRAAPDPWVPAWQAVAQARVQGDPVRNAIDRALESSI